MTQPIRTFCLGLDRTGPCAPPSRDGDFAALLQRAGEDDFLSDQRPKAVPPT